MRFIAVRCNNAKGDESYCAFCCTTIGQEYVRDLENRLVYHSVYCLEMHVETSRVLIEHHARMVT